MKNMKIFVLSIVGVLLLCSFASAVTVTPYFKIAREYESNPFKARKTWEGEYVCIESELVHMATDNSGNAVLVFNRRDNAGEFDAVLYDFYFMGIPDEVVSLHVGQKLKISDRIHGFRTNNDHGDAFFVDVIYPSIVK